MIHSLHLITKQKPTKNVLLIITLLSTLMLLTRGSHFSGVNALPEASWVIFMVAGSLLPAWSFAWLMTLAIGIDGYAFSFGGVSGTCFSITYGMLIPAYGVMWLAGRFTKSYLNATLQNSAVLFGFSMAGTLICELISSGSFYLFSGHFDPTFAEFFAREFVYIPAVFSSSAFWTVIFILSVKATHMYRQSVTENVQAK